MPKAKAETEKKTTATRTAKAPAKKDAGAMFLEIPPLDLRFFTLKIVGDTPLIMHAWGQKAIQEIKGKQAQTAKTKGRDVRRPEKEYVESMYWMSGQPEILDTDTDKDILRKVQEAVDGGATFGFKATAFKKSACQAAYRAGITPNIVSSYGAFHILGPDGGDLVQIHGTPEMREDMVRIGNGVADIRYRGEFKTWWADVPIKYNAGIINPQLIANMFNLGGFVCGLGEWRIEKAGMKGSFHVHVEQVSQEEVERVNNRA